MITCVDETLAFAGERLEVVRSSQAKTCRGGSSR
jgi:hypothetical protein